MNRSKISLLATGVSMLALGVVAPGVAQAQNDPGIYQGDGDADGQNIYVIPNFFYGGIDSVNGDGFVEVNCGQAGATPAEGTAQAGCTASEQGAIIQEVTTAGAATNSLSFNASGLATVEAATSNNLLAETQVDATIETGVNQYAAGSDATNNFSLASPSPSNTGAFNILADADMIQATGDANAHAEIDTAGIFQQADATDTAVNNFTNEINVNILVTADASAATGNAIADAELDGAGIGQIAANSPLGTVPAQNAVNNFTNTGLSGDGGNINIAAEANATAPGGIASATASIDIGIGQLANGTETATNNFANSGNISILAGAHAEGETANASATIGDDFSVLFNNEGIGQVASATGVTGVAQNNFTNSGGIDITAAADAVASLGNAEADATIETGIYQEADAGQSAINVLNNTPGAGFGEVGTIAINAQATALANNVGATGGTAEADATVQTGIQQLADGDVLASSGFTNTGTVDITASALADGDFDANADASVGTGVYQTATASENASVSLTNGGTLNVIADAHAIAGNPGATTLVDGSADATAFIGTGIYQDADATGTSGIASAAILNTGTVNIVADAEADAGGTAEGSAFASASVQTGIYQSATANNTSGAASVDLTNTGGTINIHAIADANGSEATASASVGTGIYQSANAGGTGGVASVDLINSGTIDIVADANAVAVGTTLNVGSIDADASATIGTGIYQTANAGGASGNASVNLNNSGTINIVADADAVAASASAYASATISTGIYQTANANGANGVANVDLVNSGTININAHAQATGTTGSASASISTGIYQEANANGASGVASIDFTNSGTINIGATAIANGGSADASASIFNTGVYQSASANGASGVASVDLINSGTINISANANAAATGTGSADATATISTAAFYQTANANGAGGLASVNVVNSGTINIGANATAVAASSHADASATISAGFSQTANANGADGVANIDLVNSGIINIAANAQATGTSATATATVSTGFYQSADANGATGVASIDFTNSGTINISANADAVAIFSASANATVGTGIGQDASANGVNGVADVSLINSGTINLTVDAQATGSSATATASLTSGIHQEASANGANGVASVSLVNGPGVDPVANPGVINVLVTANAVGSTASALASVSTVFDQSATANGVDGQASADIVNSGTINVDVNAIANASLIPGPAAGFASATATVSDIFNQTANANGTGGVASVSLVNSGLIDIAVLASAQADFSASAAASINNVIDQEANATGTDGVATVRVTNSTADMIVAAVSAVATGAAVASAFATIGDGIEQDATGQSAGAFVTNDGVLTFSANASALAGVFASASASVEGIDQSANGTTNASAIFDNSGTLTVSANALAVAGNITPFGGDASASAFAFGVNQVASATEVTLGVPVVTVLGTLTVDTTAPAGPALASLVNSGGIDVAAAATATGAPGFAAASASASGIDQFVSGDPATANVTNDAPLSVSAVAEANGATSAAASAWAGGIFQDAQAIEFVDSDFFATALGTDVFIDTTTPVGAANAVVTNNDAITVAATANAIATAGPAVASAGGTFTTTVGGVTVTVPFAVVGIDQEVDGDPASAIVTNTGTLDVSAIANASAGAGAATAQAFGLGVIQQANAVTFTEEDLIAPLGTETETLTTTPSGVVTASVVNDGSLTVTAAANAVAATGSALAVAGGDNLFAFNTVAILPAAGIVQVGHGADVTLSVENNGDLTVAASATADGDPSAVAAASAAGVLQFGGAFGWSTVATQVPPATTPTTGTPIFSAAVGPVDVSVVNTATIDVAAVANADAATFASASAFAIGVGQVAIGTDWTATLDNDGDIVVNAAANATATGAAGTASAFAGAVGYGLVASGGTLTVDNSGTLDVSATAVAAATTGFASAYAVGMTLIATTFVAGGDGGFNGTIDNGGTLSVLASASGPVTSASSATASGIFMASGYNNTVITNSGTLDVRAITADGGAATANGILVVDNGAGAGPLPADLLTITNDGGSIFAGISIDGGATFQRGMAIDVSDAPNPTLINLLGEGSVYGNIDLAATDNIVVDDGETSFDGIINPEFAPQPGVPLDGTQGLDPSPAFDGTLTITGDGSLFLRDNPAPTNVNYDGPAQVYIGTFTTTGNLALELQTAGPAANVTHYPQIFANTANLGGTLEIVPNNLGIVGPVLYDDILFDNVIEADVRNGTFASLIYTPPGALVSAEIIYDAFNNVDIGISRTPFGQLGDETDNQAAVGAGIENVYSPTLTGPFGNLLAEIFTLNAADYYNALDQLSGVEYPLYVHALRNNTFTNNMFIADQTDCAIDVRGVDACRAPEKGARFWIMGTYNWQDLDGNDNFIGYDANNWAALLGMDYRFGNNLQLGVFAGYRNVDVSFNDTLGSEVDSDGWQLGLTAAYDVGNFYVRAVGSYSMLDGDSERDISIGSGPGLVSGTAIGEPDSNVWSFYGEAGARFDMGGSWITPFIAVDHTSIKLKSFIETGVPGANLALDSQTESQTSGLIGLKWAGNFGGIVPEAKIAYRHDFGDRITNVGLRFADAPVGSDFDKAERFDRGSIIAGLSLAGVVSDKVTGRIGYQGRFNDEVKDHAIYGSLTFKFGGAEPAPEPAPEPLPVPPPPPPPPPPPEVVQTVGPYIVFFDWDKDEITPQAAAILDNAAATYQQTGSAQVMIAGHADRSGSASYNVGLSERRAANVRSYLAGRGVPDGAMATEAFGESRPLVETADGVREPQNRRVEITYGPGAGQ